MPGRLQGRPSPRGAWAPALPTVPNEEAVKLFLEDKIGFLDIGRLVEAVVDSDSFGGSYNPGGCVRVTTGWPGPSSTATCNNGPLTGGRRRGAPSERETYVSLSSPLWPPC